MYKGPLNIEDDMNKFQKETLTPYKVALVMLIKDYCSPDVGCQQSGKQIRTISKKYNNLKKRNENYCTFFQ